MSRSVFFFWILLVCVLLGVFHSMLLRGCAMLLIVDQPVPEDATTVLLAGGDRQFDRAAGLLHDGPCTRVLVQSDPPNRLVYIGILPAWSELCRRELAARGVAEDSLIAQRTQGHRSWDSVRDLDRWLAKHPEEHLVVLTDRFHSGNLAFVYDRVLGAEHRHRVTIRGLIDRRYDETDWWRSRRGWKAMVGALTNRLVLYWLGEQPIPPYDPDPDAYERRVLERWGGGGGAKGE